MKRAVIVTLLVSLACLSFGCRHTALLVTQYPEGTEHVQELIKALKDGFDEQNIWKARFAPFELGEWKYIYVFSNVKRQNTSGEGHFL